MKHLLVFTLMLSSIAFSQDQIEIQVGEAEVQEVSRNLEEQAAQAESPEDKRVLEKLSGWVKDVGEKPKTKNIGRKLGKASSFVATETIRPFVTAGSFIRGVFTKSDSSSARVKELVFNFYLDNEEDLNRLYKDPSVYSEYLEDKESANIFDDYQFMVENMFKNKVLESVKGILADINFNPTSVTGIGGGGEEKKLQDADSLEELAELLQNFDAQKSFIDIVSIDADKLTNDTVRANLACNNLGSIAPHIDIESFVSNLGKSLQKGEAPDIAMETFINEGLINDLQAFVGEFVDLHDGKVWKNKQIVGEVSEGIGALVAQYAVPSMALSSIIGAGGGLYMGVTAAATAGTVISTRVCTKKKEQLKNDPDFRNFCSYVVFRNSQKLIKSKAKGYLAGAKLRKRIADKIAERKRRKAYIKDCRQGGKSRKECKLEYKQLM